MHDYITLNLVNIDFSHPIVPRSNCNNVIATRSNQPTSICMEAKSQILVVSPCVEKECHEVSKPARAEFAPSQASDGTTANHVSSYITRGLTRLPPFLENCHIPFVPSYAYLAYIINKLTSNVEIQQQQQFIYRFRLYKGLVPQIATKLVEAGQGKKNYEMQIYCYNDGVRVLGRFYGFTERNCTRIPLRLCDIMVIF